MAYNQCNGSRHKLRAFLMYKYQLLTSFFTIISMVIEVGHILNRASRDLTLINEKDFLDGH